MATAKKLPSGSWRCQVFSHFEEQIQPDGTVKKKRIYKSFTCDDPSVNNPVPVSLLSGDRKPQIRFLGNHHSGSGNLYHKSFRM